MTLEERAYKLIEILATPSKEIVFDIELEDITINSIEIFEEIVYINIWTDDFELKYFFAELSYNDKKTIVQTLENILKN